MEPRGVRFGHVRLLLVYLLLAGVRHVGGAKRLICVRLRHDVATVNAAEDHQYTGACDHCPSDQFPHCFPPLAAGLQ